MSSAFNIPAGYKLVSGEAYGQRYQSLVAPDGKIIENAYEQGAPAMFAFLSALAAAPTPSISAVPGEPVAKLQAIGWAAFDARENRMRTRCETREQIDAYIHQQHQSRDDITLYARPIFAGERS